MQKERRRIILFSYFQGIADDTAGWLKTKAYLHRYRLRTRQFSGAS
jgi:hypothetical protein